MNDSSAKTADAPLDMIQNFASISALLASITALEVFVEENSIELLQASQWNEAIGGPLLDRYKSALRKFWDDAAPVTGADYVGSAHDMLAQLFHESALAEIRWMKATRRVTWEQAESFSGMLNGSAPGISRTVTTSINKTVVYLPFDVLVEPATQAAWLLPHDGQLARFSSEAGLLLHLSALLFQLEQQQALLGRLPLHQQESVQVQLGTGEGLHLSLRTVPGTLFNDRVKLFRTTQDREVNGLNRELSLITDPAVRARRIEHIRSLCGLDLAQSRRMELLLTTIRSEQTPQWLRYGNDTDTSLFTSRGAQQARCVAEVDKQVGPLASYSAYATDYLSGELAKQGVELDPAQVEITLTDTFIVGYNFQNLERKMTLDRLELCNIYEDDGIKTKLRLTEADHAAGLREAMVRSIIQGKDLRVAYPAELRARYFEPSVANAMLDLQVARLATSLIAAKLQGVIDAQVFKRIDGLADSYQGPSRNGVETYFVQLDNGRFQLADVLVLGYQDNNQTTYLLYAPNSPAGQDWSKHTDQQRLLDTITGWSATLEGRSYLLGQVSFGERAAMVKSLEVMASTPHLLTRTSLLLQRTVLASWRATLGIMVNYQASRIVADAEVLTPGWYVDAGVAARRRMMRLDAEIALRTRAYHAGTQIPTFVDYARNTLQRAFDTDPSRSHDPQRWDVSKFAINLDGQWRSLVWLAMNGVKRGVDVSTLPVSAQVSATSTEREIVSDLMARFLNNHDVPEDYARLLNDTFLAPDAPGREWRTEAYLQVAQLELDRALLQLRLDPQAREGIHSRSRLLQRDVRINLRDKFEISGPHYGNNKSSIFHLRIKDSRIQGVYLFLDTIDGVESYVLYTPHAPDGIWFRPFEDLARAIEHNELGGYLRSRVAFNGLTQFDNFMVNLENKGYAYSFIENIGKKPRAAAEDVVKFEKEHDAIIHNIIRDVDASTTSKVERFTAMIVARTIQVLGVVTLPFPPARMALGVAKVLMSLYQAAEAYRTADRAQAAWHLLDAALGVASLAGVSGKPQEKFLEALFKGPPPDVAKQMITQFSARLTSELDTYLRSVTIPQKGNPPTQAWLQPA